MTFARGSVRMTWSAMIPVISPGPLSLKDLGIGIPTAVPSFTASATSTTARLDVVAAAAMAFEMPRRSQGRYV